MDDNSRKRADQFIAATERIKEDLARKYQIGFKGIGEAWRHADAKKHRLVQKNRALLKTATDLRNVIQHTPVLDGEVIAVPRQNAVEAIEKLADQLVNPPQVREYMCKPVTVTSNSPLRNVATSVVEQYLSQIPVYDGSTYVGLFTTNSLARWLSSSIEADSGELIADNITVAQVLEHAEEHERAEFVKPTKPAIDVCGILSRGQAPPCVLITTDGSSEGELQGILTRFDVVSINEQLSIA